MRPTRLAIAVLAFSAIPLAAQETPVDAILKAVMPQTRQTLQRRGLAPAAWSTTTRGGAMRAIEEWVWNSRPTAIASDLADDYYKQNQTEHEISGVLPEGVLAVDLRKLETGHTYDWARLNESYPRAKSVVVFSEPAIDSLGTTAIVRADFLAPDDKGYMAFYELEKQPLDGSWKVKGGAFHPIVAMFRDDIHSGHTPKQCPVPRDKRHPTS